MLDALEEPTAADAARRILEENPEDYNPFHLLIVDADGAYVVWSDGDLAQNVVLEPGVHVVTERSFGAAENGRARFLEHSIDELAAAGELSRQSLSSLLRIRRIDDIDSTCVLIPEMSYGTRSSTLVDIDRRELFYADGPPCEVDYADHSGLLREVLP